MTKFRRQIDRSKGVTQPNILYLFLYFLFLCAHILQVGNRVPFLGSLRIEFILGALTIFSSIPFLKTVVVPEARRLLGWITSLIIVFLMMVLISGNPSHSWNIFVDKVFKLLMLGFCTAIATSCVRGVYVFLVGYLVSFLKMAQEGVVGILTGSMMWDSQGVPRLHGSTDLYFHPNSFAGTQLGSAAFLLHLVKPTRGMLRVAIIFQIIGVGLVVLYCGSRTAYIAAVAYVLILAFQHQNRIKALIVVAFLVVIAIYAIPEDYAARIQTLFTGEEIEGNSMGTRWVIIKDAVSIFLQNPLGVGVDQFRFVREAQFGRSQDTHNLYLQVATDLGVFGVICFFGMIKAVFQTLGVIRKRLEELLLRIDSEVWSPGIKAAMLGGQVRIIRAAAEGLIGLLVIRLFLGLFGHDLYENYWWIAVGLVVGLLSAVQQLEDNFQEITRQSSETIRENG